MAATEDGAHGPGGTLEKNVTLSVARRLKAALEARLGVRVILTRDGDQTVELDERAALANNNKADLFISLHANASVRPSAAGAEVFYLSLEEYGDQAQRVARGETEALPVFGGGTRDIEVILWEMAQARYIEESAVLAQAVEGSAARTRADEPARASSRRRSACSSAPTCPRCSSRWASSPTRIRSASSPPSVPERLSCRRSSRASSAIRDKLGSPRPAGPLPQPGTPGRRPAPLMSRRSFAVTVIAVLAIAGGWWLAARMTRRATTEATQPVATATRQPPPTRRKITATLYYVAEDGMSLVGVQREVPFGETVLDQARQIVDAHSSPSRRRLSPPSHPETTLRALYLTERGDAFVDLSADVAPSTPAARSTSSLRCTRLVNALTTNLPAVTRVQILIDGKEVDTLAGHVDLRHPLQKNLKWVKTRRAIHDT